MSINSGSASYYNMKGEGYVPDGKTGSETSPSPYARHKGTGKHIELLRNNRLWATDGPDKTAIRELFDQIRAEPDCSNKFEQKVLLLAIRCGRQAFVQVLLNHDRVDPDVADKTGSSPLHVAARGWNEAIVKTLLDDDRVNPNVQDKSGCSPLRAAVHDGKGIAVKILLDDIRVDPNIADNTGSSPLHMAVRGGNDIIVKLLLDDDRVDPNITDEAGRTPLHLAACYEQETIIAILLRHSRVDLTCEDKEGHTPLLYALERKVTSREQSRAPIIKMLLSAIGQDAKLTNGQLLLSRAARQDDEEVVRLLLDDCRIDLSSKDVFGLTQLTWKRAREYWCGASWPWWPEAWHSIENMSLDSSGAKVIPQTDPRREIAGGCLRFWMSTCDQRHVGACCAKPVQNRLPQEIPTWVIDVSRGCIVPGQQASRYAALSYVWDTSKSNLTHTSHLIWPDKKNTCHYDERLLLTRDNLSDFRTPGHLQGPVANRIPLVIRDAMALITEIGQRYIWVDCLCIVQGDDETREQVDHMHQVYSGAYFTIIAATQDGLFSKPRIPGTERSDLDEYWQNWGAKRHIEKLYRQLLNSKWATRGWTFQEQIMSKRAIIFLEGDIFWDCQHAVWDQDYLLPDKTIEDFVAPHYGTAHRMFETSWPDFRTYLELIGLYNDRDLSYPQDALPAISGILTALTHSFPHGFICGLPRLFLHEALLWQPFSQASRRVAKYGGGISINGQLSSWSWCGWRCPVDPFSLRTGQAYLDDEESRARVGSWNTSPLVQWSALSKGLQDEELIKEAPAPSTCDEPWRDPEVELPSRWSRFDNGDITAESPCTESLFMHVSDMHTRFRRPVSIRNTSPLDQGPQKDWPFLSCVTTRATFRIASLLKPYVYQRLDWVLRLAPSYNHSLGTISVFKLPLFTYANGPPLDDICHVICLEDAQGTFAGLLRRMDDTAVPLGDEIELIAISTGSVNHADLQHAFEDSVNQTQQCSYPKKIVPFWRVFPGKENERINVYEWAPDFQKHLMPPIVEEEPSGIYHFYNVLWIEREGDIAYRRAAGRVPKDVWEKNCSEPSKIILG